MPFGLSRLGSPPTVTGLSVVIGVGLPVRPRLDAPNSTTVFGAFAFEDHRSPSASMINPHGPWTEPWPLSDNVYAGASVTAPAPTAGSMPDVNSKIVVEALFAMYRLPDASNTIPSGPENAGFDESIVAGVTFAPPACTCALVKTSTTHAPLSV